MRKAVVIHPRFTEYGGGEVIALHVIKALQDSGFSVSLVSDNFNPAEVEKNFGMGRILEEASHIRLQPFRPLFRRFLALQHLRYASKVLEAVKDIDADVVFSTQSVLYYAPSRRTLHIVYDMVDLFQILGGKEHGPLASSWKSPYYRFLRQGLDTNFRANRLFIPLSNALEQELSRLNYPHTQEVYPPIDMVFKPRSKRKQVCLVSRIAPQKNIHDFMEIARKIPRSNFILVAAESERNQNYARKLLARKPTNVDYVEERIRNRPELLEESKVYLYTSTEPGIGIALGQAMGAGCIPITPAWGGGAEMIRATGVGSTYQGLDQAARKVEKALESTSKEDYPEYISERATIFRSDRFDNHIAQLIRAES